MPVYFSQRARLNHFEQPLPPEIFRESECEPGTAGEQFHAGACAADRQQMLVGSCVDDREPHAARLEPAYFIADRRIAPLDHAERNQSDLTSRLPL